MSIILNKKIICTDDERLYLFRNSSQIEGQTGHQGYLRGDFDKGRDTFFSNFFPKKSPFDDGFSDALQEVMDTLRSEDFLRSFSDMRTFCYQDGYDDRIDTAWATQFGVRIDHKGFTFMIRLCPKMGDYHVWVYSFKTELLNQHMEKARSGIRFIDSSYQEKFRLEDGGKIRVTPLSGAPVEHVCRYIDDYHFEVTGVPYHICEFAEYRERAGDKVEPVSGRMKDE
ncbi:MAG: hypothetical protein IJI27_05450 [Oscillospiraceae bacterium]|nr:hypothetical protein [Oscillospiraceae bacterium]